MSILKVCVCFVTSCAAVAAANGQASSVTELAKFLSSEAGAGHREGAALAGSPGYLFVGAPGADCGSQGSGAVYFFTSPTSFAQKICSGRPGSAGFGSAIAIGGVDLLAIGAPDSNGGDGLVEVYINSMSLWVDLATLTPPADAWSAGGRFGAALAISGTTLLVGAPGSGGQVTGGATPGIVYVYEDNGATLVPVDRIFNPTAGTTRFGEALSVSGSRFVAGRPNDALFAAAPGSALVYALSGGVWSLEATLGGGGSAFDRFGASVDLDGARALIGAPAVDRAYVELRSGAAWSQEGTLSPQSGASGVDFGSAVDLHVDRALVASASSDHAGAGSGSAHVFVHNATNWYELVEFADGETAAGDGFGGAIRLSSVGATIGAPLRADSGPATGATYTFGVVTPRIFCTSQVNSQGCTPAISFDGLPGASTGPAFTLSASKLLNQALGTFFYGLSGPQSVPLLGGTLCAKPPVRRTPPAGTGGTPSGVDCSGTFSFDFSAWVQSGADPSLVPGLLVDAQIWTRDPAAGAGSNLTNAVEFTWLP